MNTVPPPIADHVPMASAISPVRRFCWSLRRELWENRYIYLAPAAVGAMFLLGFIVSALRLAPALAAATAPDRAPQLRTGALGPYDFAAGLLMLTTMVVGAFYSIDALYGERRDRSILFWKSMPVSDWTTVLAKASIPVLLLPLFAFAAAAVTHVIMFALSFVIASAPGSAGSQLSIGSFFRMELLTLYHLVTVHALWPAPIFAWFLLVSVWARRVPFVWAVLPPIVACALEKIAFDTAHLTDLLTGRILGSGASSQAMTGMFPTNPATHATPVAFFISPGLWIGFAIAALFLFAAARLRREQGIL